MRKSSKIGKLSEASFIIGLIVAMFFVVTNIPMIPVMENGHIRSWQSLTFDALAADPGTGKSGVVNVSLVKHGLYSYTTNITRNASMFAWGETNNTEIGANVPYGIKFDIVVKVVWNRSMMYNVSKSNFTWEWVNATIALTLIGRTSGYPGGGGAGFNLSGEFNISQAGWASSRERVWAYYVYGSGTHSGTGAAAPAGGNNAGISINKSQRIPTCYFKFFAYY